MNGQSPWAPSAPSRGVVWCRYMVQASRARVMPLFAEDPLRIPDFICESAWNRTPFSG